jgi:hypothetical protein
VTIRNLEGKSLAYNDLSVELDIYGNAKLLIPLHQIKYNNIEELDTRYINIINRSSEKSFTDIKLLHLRTIFGAISGLLNKYFDFIMENGFNENVQIKLRLSNCWRTSLYSQSEAFIKHVEEFGVPICMKGEQYFPLEPLEVKISEFKLHPIVQASVICCFSMSALGIPDYIVSASVLEEMIKYPQM